MLRVLVDWIKFVPLALVRLPILGLNFFIHAVLETLKSQGLHREDVLGTVGPFEIFLGSLDSLVGPSELPDEVIFYFFSKIILFPF